LNLNMIKTKKNYRKSVWTSTQLKQLALWAKPEKLIGIVQN